VTDPRLIAVRAEPAEVQPGSPASYEALLAGSGDATLLRWAFCTAPKPLTELNTVGNACLDDPAALVDLGQGARIMATVPIDACQRFGPDPPPQPAGEPPLRPRDPDVTGGYYQPLRVDDARGVSFPLQRVTCNLANASAAVVADFRSRYLPNRNPKLADVSASLDGAPIALDALPADAVITLRASWTADDAETFPVLDLETHALVDTREAMRVSWFGTDGNFALDRSGRAPDDPLTYAETSFHTPSTPGPLSLWVVLRDSRGGVDWRSVEAGVR
jgi:hypothetical protein